MERDNHYEFIGVVLWGASCGRIADAYADVRGKNSLDFTQPNFSGFRSHKPLYSSETLIDLGVLWTPHCEKLWADKEMAFT